MTGQSEVRRIGKSIEHFLFPNTSDLWLTILRIGLGVQVLVYSLCLRAEISNLFRSDAGGLTSRDLTEAITTAATPLIPRVGWLVVIGNAFGLSEQTAVFLIWTLLVVTALCLIVGCCCRIAAVICWFVYLCLAKSAGPLEYGVDNLTTIGLFYLTLSPLPDRYAVDSKLWNRPQEKREFQGFFRRVLQLHLCVVYFSSGITKLLGPGWWTGESIWRSLTRPPFNVLPVELIVSCRAILPLIGIAVCILEIGYFVLIWWQKTRLIWLISILGMHLAIGFSMGLYLFGSVMVVLNVAAFGPEYILGAFRSKTIAPSGALLSEIG